MRNSDTITVAINENEMIIRSKEISSFLVFGGGKVKIDREHWGLIWDGTGGSYSLGLTFMEGLKFKLSVLSPIKVYLQLYVFLFYFCLSVNYKMYYELFQL